MAGIESITCLTVLDVLLSGSQWWCSSSNHALMESLTIASLAAY
jgi:hypothetical protein